MHCQHNVLDIGCIFHALDSVGVRPIFTYILHCGSPYLRNAAHNAKREMLSFSASLFKVPIRFAEIPAIQNGATYVYIMFPRNTKDHIKSSHSTFSNRQRHFCCVTNMFAKSLCLLFASHRIRLFYDKSFIVTSVSHLVSLMKDRFICPPGLITRTRFT